MQLPIFVGLFWIIKLKQPIPVKPQSGGHCSTIWQGTTLSKENVGAVCNGKRQPRPHVDGLGETNAAKSQSSAKNLKSIPIK
jgi:hypothetical protein